jgi:predicted transcriptional regulator
VIVATQRRAAWALLNVSSMQVQSIMNKDVQVCRSNQSAQSALRLMRDHDCGCIPVVDHDAVVGIVTDRDIALACAEADKSPSQLRLSQIMTTNVFAVSPHTPIHEVEAMMGEQRIRRVPVVDESGRPVGIVSLNDIARAAAAHGWKSNDGLTARSVAATLAAICQESGSQARAV